MDQQTRQSLEETRDKLRNVSQQIEGRRSGHAKAAKPSFDSAAANLDRALERAEGDESISTIEDLFPEGESW